MSLSGLGKYKYAIIVPAEEVVLTRRHRVKFYPVSDLEVLTRISAGEVPSVRGSPEPCLEPVWAMRSRSWASLGPAG